MWPKTCFESIEECKKVAFDEEDEVKRSEEQIRCFSSFKCNPGEDSIREDLRQRAERRADAKGKMRGGRPRYGHSTNVAPANKVTFKVVAACLVTVLGLAHF